MIIIEIEEKEETQMNLQEMITILKTTDSVEEIDYCREEIAKLIPSVRIMFSFDQKNRAHQYDLWMHCLHTVVGLPRNGEDDMLYLAALLHDIGKPDSQVAGKREGDTNMHYYGHPLRSMEIVRDGVIPELKANRVELSEDEQRRLLYYVEYHDDRVSLRMHHLRRHLRIPVSLQEFQNLMQLQVADAKAHVQLPIIAQRIEICGQLSGAYSEELYQRIQNGE